jgi:hypothetical protein
MRIGLQRSHFICTAKAAHSNISGTPMARFVLAVLLASASLITTPAAASACLWDQEVKGHEKQFKSSYIGEVVSQANSYSVVRSVSSPLGLLGLIGVLMCAGAVLIGVRLHRAPVKKAPNEPTL